MKSEPIIFTLAVALFPSDARDCSQDEMERFTDYNSVSESDPDVVKCKEEALAMGISDDDLDTYAKNKDEYCKLESCKKKDLLAVQFFENVPICSYPDGSGDSFAVALLKEIEQELEKADVCGRYLVDIKAFVDKPTNGAAYTSVMATFTTLFVIAAAQFSLL